MVVIFDDKIQTIAKTENVDLSAYEVIDAGGNFIVPGLTHRNPGAVGAALSTDISVELNADTFHIHKDLFNLVSKIKANKLCLITDCVKTGGMPDGDYNYYGRIVHKVSIKCLLPDGTVSGSALGLNEAVYNFYTNADEIGSIEIGKRADIIIADDNFNVLMTILVGEIRYKGE